MSFIVNKPYFIKMEISAQILFVVYFSFSFIGIIHCQSRAACDNLCVGTSFGCISGITQSDCPAGQFLIHKNKVCKCCPGCEARIQYGEVDNDGIDVMCTAKAPCAPGLLCDKSKICQLNKDDCLYVNRIDEVLANWVNPPTTDAGAQKVEWKSKPTCTEEGEYAAVQCKGEKLSGRCFCSDAKGNRIFGWSWWREAEEMSCACSRKRWELENDETNPRNDVTLHCNSAGGFEELQCDSGVCWCAEEHTGLPIKGSIVVPETMMLNLPCFNVTLMGSQYMRQCESMKYGQAVIRNTLKQHGTMEAAMTSVFCDYDGSYAPYQIESGVIFCAWQDKSRIGSFQAESGSRLASIDCNCARDQKYFEEAGLAHSLVCESWGNYRWTQELNGQYYCVDNDGFAVTDFFDLGLEIDCSLYMWHIKLP